MKKNEWLNNCLCCGGSNLKLVLDLNNQPLANSYLDSETEQEESYPLGINFCRDCTHVQLTYAVDPSLLFSNYIYVSGTTKTLRDYFDWFVTFTRSYVDDSENKAVLDIACNDGTQLDSYKRAGFKTYGIDPATNLYELSSKNHNVICDFLSKENLNKFNTKFNIITAQNVFAHNTYPQEFLESCKDYLAPGGCLFIQTSQANMFENNEFDTIYHEHISFFNIKSFSTLAKKAGFNLIDVKKTSIHGTSYVFVLSLDRDDNSEKLISGEMLLTEDYMTLYSNKCKQIADETKNKIKELRDLGYTIVGYGAAAKGNTFLNFADLKLDFIVDDNVLKHDKFTPGQKILIKHPDSLIAETNKICIVPLAWNFFDEIKEKVLSRRSDNIIFLKYFPEVLIHA